MPDSVNPELLLWARRYCDLDPTTIEVLPNEASTRRFWRCRAGSHSFVLMHSPPQTENNQQFVTLSDVFRRQGVPVPKVLHHEVDRGYLIIEDVGQEDFFAGYSNGRIIPSIDLAINYLLKIQEIHDKNVPLYTAERLRTEIGIFEDYICNEFLGGVPAEWSEITSALVRFIDELPRVTVHRDFHCRNLLLRESHPCIGIVDFQDALFGPITYDLASLLYDCYWEHDPELIHAKTKDYWERANAANLPVLDSVETFLRALKLTALQRLLKAAGIFVRLWMQKKQKTHLNSVLPTLRKAREICRDIDFVTDLGDWLEADVLNRTEKRLRAIK